MGPQKIFLLINLNLSPNCIRDQTFVEKYEVKNFLCILDNSEDFVNFTSYLTKRIKSKMSNDFMLCIVYLQESYFSDLSEFENIIPLSRYILYLVFMLEKHKS